MVELRRQAGGEQGAGEKGCWAAAAAQPSKPRPRPAAAIAQQLPVSSWPSLPPKQVDPIPTVATHHHHHPPLEVAAPT